VLCDRVPRIFHNVLAVAAARDHHEGQPQASEVYERCGRKEQSQMKARGLIVAILMFLVLGGATRCVFDSGDDDDKETKQQQKAP